MVIIMNNYFNSLSFRKKLIELQKCSLIQEKEFEYSIQYLKNKKIVILGCGSQGLNQGLNMRDSGLEISYALRSSSIISKKNSWKRAKKNNFKVDTYENLIPQADLVINLTPDKQHSSVVKKAQLFMKKNAILGYSHGFNIVEMKEEIRKDITVIMVAPKCPGTEVREEYKRGFGVPTLIAVHSENDPIKEGILAAKSWAASIGSHRAGVLKSSFIAEVKSDLMGEQTILCGILQTSSIVYFNYLVKNGIQRNYAKKLIQKGWEVITESLKHGGINLMMDRLPSFLKIKAYNLSNKIKNILKPLFVEHMDNILSGKFSSEMILDWNNKDKNLLDWRSEIQNTNFEKTNCSDETIFEQDYFNQGIFMVSIIKAGVELSFEIMVSSGIKPESAYYESLHELPLIANTISRKGLYEMNLVISDTAEYGSYLFSYKAIPILKHFLKNLKYKDLQNFKNYTIDNTHLVHINEKIRNNPIELIGKKLRNYMKSMKKITFKY